MREPLARRPPVLPAFVAAAALAGCGDPLLPSDYAGPPAGAVAGNVLDRSGEPTKDVQRPGLSVEWLSGLGADNESEAPLVEQAVTYQRSLKLDNDWDIGLQLPTHTSRLGSVLDAVSSRHEVRFSVGKMVYFDDRVPDGRFDFGCRGPGCDTVKAVSVEYVVFVDVPPTCQSSTGLRPSVAAGYHYYRFEDGAISELGPGQAMSFVLRAEPLGEAVLSAELRAFAGALLESWSIAARGGC